MKRILRWRALPALVISLALAPAALAQTRPYLGYVYPAGGQQGTNVLIRLGGQNLLDVNALSVSGSGVTAKLEAYYRRLNNEELQLLNEQMKGLKRSTTAVASAMAPMMKSETPAMTSTSPMMMSATGAEKDPAGPGKDETAQKLIAKIEDRVREFVQTPACVSISGLVFVRVSIAPDAEPGEREVRLITPRGVSNPMSFHVGQVPEFTRKPMLSATLQVLGKEASALRKRPANEAEVRITIPCTVNGQIASGEVNRYRFTARQGQRLVLSTQARQLIPYIADAVPGWFQPVLVLYDAKGKEVAFADDYRFKPDPVILYEVPKDGEYVFAIQDSIYRGREDFVYRITVGELPFVTSLFPLGGQVGALVPPSMKGWNLQDAILPPPPRNAGPGIYELAANRKGFVSNRMPFALDRLASARDAEPNNTLNAAQKVTLPVIVNGRIDKSDDWDVFQFTGKSNDLVVAEVQARRLDSALDSVIKLSDASGRLLAFSDDREDLGAGVNTHHADSWLMARLPADGTYFVQLGDTARTGGEEFGYRLRLSAPQPDFELRAVPSSVSLRTNSSAAITVYAQRKDGFAGPIKLSMKDPPAGFSASPVTLSATQTMASISIKGPLDRTAEPVSLSIIGRAKMGDKEIIRDAVPSEDRMQAFLWRHLVPASDLKVLVFDPGYQPPPKRIAPIRPPSTVATNAIVGLAANAATNSITSTNAAAKPKFSKQQVTSRLRQLKLLYEEGLFTDAFYDEKVAECESAQ